MSRVRNIEARIQQIGTAVPKNRYTQSEVLSELQKIGFGQDRKARAIFGRAGVKARHTVVNASYYAEQKSTQVRNEHYMREALPLGEEAICRALDNAVVPPEAIDELLIVSCTGLDIPGLDLRLAGRLGMRPDLRRTCILGMGCYGAFPALLRAQQAASSQHDRNVLVLAVELCSLHFQIEDTPENIISSALFADGASAALVSSTLVPQATSAPHIIDSATYCDYQTFDDMAFHVTDQGFHMRLSAYVPDLLASNISKFVDKTLAQNNLHREDIKHWGIHPGGSKILDFVQAQLGLSNKQMEASRAVLSDYGNMSSATILFVLDKLQRLAEPRAGEYGMLLGFGPGLTSEAILLRW
jgi:predicted naringenin-chalcone synthase